MALIIHPPKPDRNKIDLSDDAVARHWAKKLGKSKEEIAVAIEKVGDNCESVRKELGCEPSSEIIVALVLHRVQTMFVLRPRPVEQRALQRLCRIGFLT